MAEEGRTNLTLKLTGTSAFHGSGLSFISASFRFAHFLQNADFISTSRVRGKGRKEEVSLEKPKKGKQNVKLKKSAQTSPNSGKFVLVIIILFLLNVILRL